MRVAYLSNPKLTFEEMVKVIMKQLGIKTRSKSKLADLEAVNDFLRGLQPGERVVIMMDEAQGLSDETMEQLRLFSSSGKPDEKQLHFVFIGQPELLRRLTNPSLRQLEQRIGAKTVLNPLQRAECREYIEQRLKAVNGTTERIFKPGALRYLIRHGGGIPRRINVLCHNALLLAYSGGAPPAPPPMVEAGVTEYPPLFPPPAPPPPPPPPRRSPDGPPPPSNRHTRMLALARALNPHELRAFDEEPESPVPPQADGGALEKPGPMVQAN